MEISSDEPEERAGAPTVGCTVVVTETTLVVVCAKSVEVAEVEVVVAGVTVDEGDPLEAGSVELGELDELGTSVSGAELDNGTDEDGANDEGDADGAELDGATVDGVTGELDSEGVPSVSVFSKLSLSGLKLTFGIAPDTSKSLSASCCTSCL